ncbi:hypothetical protein GUJ93_ZPchr0010g8688 [Zizania palustris]|uniref:Uncharacterized protein n=1 Tax=Zizania palustris TaxID=103762 RepID=A0A8J5WFJ7_ZIZPA|nr:hypothetical protein GUJ93_ZPchr0010g8688 [Zizania palustris]
MSSLWLTITPLSLTWHTFIFTASLDPRRPRAASSSAPCAPPSPPRLASLQFAMIRTCLAFTSRAPSAAFPDDLASPRAPVSSSLPAFPIVDNGLPPRDHRSTIFFAVAAASPVVVVCHGLLPPRRHTPRVISTVFFLAIATPTRCAVPA